MLCGCTASFVDERRTLAEMVNPLMGTDSKYELSNGNTYPAIALPWGMNFWMPQTGSMGNGWAYTYGSNKIVGFKQTHQPSPWINDYGQFSLMPVIGMKPDQQQRASWFSHKAEEVHPYYYSVYLADHDVVTELTPTERCAWFRFTMPQSDSAAVVIDAFDRGSFVRVDAANRRIYGYTTRNSGGVPENFKNYFIVEFDRDFDFWSLWDSGVVVSGDRLGADREGAIAGSELGPGQMRATAENGLGADYAGATVGNELSANHAGAIAGFKSRRGEVIEAKVSSSFISFEQAELNMERELGGKTFDKVKSEGFDRWNEVLGRIEVEGNERERETFYSCLYRAVLFPRMFYEYDKEGNPYHYSPYNGEVLPGYLFTDTGFWDTFRSLFPLLNLVYPSMNEKMQAGLLNTYKESGFLPEWASPGHRNCMVGNNSASVVSDAIIKGVTDPAIVEELYDAMVKTANSLHPTVKSTGRLGYEYYNEIGYVPYDVGINESAARTLEYAYNDWCISRVAEKLGRPSDEVKLYEQRGQNYRNLFDPETKLMRGKNEDGTFQSPFNPFKWGDAFTEGNSWHYTWSVFHDIEGLIGLMGGREEFVAMLDSVFNLPPIFDESYYRGVIHEIREMQIMNMGNYAHGNQPIQHMIYLYNYGGEPWKAQYWTREVMNKLYKAEPDGYCGDEDNGQTSAWYVFSALGFYPVAPASDQYVIGSPLFNSATIHLENGNKITIKAENNGAKNRYIQSLTMNGKIYTKNWLNHFDMLKGAELKFRMGDNPQKNRGAEVGDMPYSFSAKK